MAHRYWRVYFTASNGSSIIGLTEVEFRATVGGADQTGSGTALSSGDFSGGFAKANAFDNGVGEWASPSIPAWIGYDFGTAVEVGQFLLANRTTDPANDAAQSPKDFLLQRSPDAVTWITEASFTGQTAWSSTGESRLFTNPTLFITNGDSVSTVAQHTVQGGSDTRETVDLLVQHTVHGASPVESWVASVAAHSVQGGDDVAETVDMVVMHTVVAPDVFPPIDPVTGDIAQQRITVSVDVSGRGGVGNSGTSAYATQAALDAEAAARAAADTSEASARTAGDATNAAAVTAEATARASGDATNASAISAEATARVAGDASTLSSAQSYTDAKVAGLSWKQAVRAATTVAGTLASSFENGDAIDGVTLATGDRILVKNQASGAENGIYVVNASGAPTRATDADAAAELVNATMYVSEGTTNADTQWTCSTNAPITLNTTALTFAQLASGGGSFTWPTVDLIMFAEIDGSKFTASSTLAGNVSPEAAFYGRGAILGWITNATNTGWIKIEFPSAVTAKSYAILPWSSDTFPSRSPKSWTFEGSNDNSAWTTLNTQTTYTSWTRYQRNLFTTSNTTAYKWYRWNVTLNGGDTYMGVSGLWLYGQPS